MPDVELNKLRE